MRNLLRSVRESSFARPIKRYKLRADVVDRLSHEMRTTLTDIVGYSEYIERRAIEPMLGFTSKIIRESGFDLVRLLNSFYDVVLLEAGDLNLIFSDVDMMELIRDVIRAHQIRASEREVKLILTRSPDVEFVKINTDSIRFVQMIDAVTFSAVRFAMPNSTVQLHVDFSEKSNFISLNFLEFGAGKVHPDVRLIEKFWNSKKYDFLQQQGPGIEMALAKALLLRLGGNSLFRVVPDAGVNFCLSIPIKVGSTKS